MPAGYVDDVLPIGVSFIGGQWDEPDLIGFAYDFEQATRSRSTTVPAIHRRLRRPSLQPHRRPAVAQSGGRSFARAPWGTSRRLKFPSASDAHTV